VEIQRAVVALGDVTIMLKLLREGVVGFIEWLDGFIDMQAHGFERLCHCGQQ
jgi:hypothetical protein